MLRTCQSICASYAIRDWFPLLSMERGAFPFLAQLELACAIALRDWCARLLDSVITNTITPSPA